MLCCCIVICMQMTLIHDVFSPPDASVAGRGHDKNHIGEPYNISQMKTCPKTYFHSIHTYSIRLNSKHVI